MRAILPQERLQVLIDNSVDLIDILDGDVPMQAPQSTVAWLLKCPLMDIGPAVTNAWHTAYLYARNDGRVKLWWDGSLLFDGTAPLVNPFNGYVEWGSGAWQYDATTTVDFDWVGYGNNF